jgi:hypothetical protein
LRPARPASLASNLPQAEGWIFGGGFGYAKGAASDRSFVSGSALHYLPAVSPIHSSKTTEKEHV